MKLDLEIAVYQQTKARDQTFEGVPDSGCHRCPRDSHALINIWSIFVSILPNNLNILKTMLWDALLVATSTSLLNTHIKFYQNRIKIGRVMSKILYVHIWAYATNIIYSGP